jgi:hypothetical protein
VRILVRLSGLELLHQRGELRHRSGRARHTRRPVHPIGQHERQARYSAALTTQLAELTDERLDRRPGGSRRGGRPLRRMTVTQQVRHRRPRDPKPRGKVGASGPLPRETPQFCDLLGS